MVQREGRAIGVGRKTPKPRATRFADMKAKTSLVIMKATWMKRKPMSKRTLSADEVKQIMEGT